MAKKNTLYRISLDGNIIADGLTREGVEKRIFLKEFDTRTIYRIHIQEIKESGLSTVSLAKFLLA